MLSLCFSVYTKPPRLTVHHPLYEEQGCIWFNITRPDQNLTHGIFQGYEIFYRENGSSISKNVTVVADPRSYKLENLSPQTLYKIQAQAITLEGKGKISDEISAKSGEGGRPGGSGGILLKLHSNYLLNKITIILMTASSSC